MPEKEKKAKDNQSFDSVVKRMLSTPPQPVKKDKKPIKNRAKK
jgi:hypothetical protein